MIFPKCLDGPAIRKCLSVFVAILEKRLLFAGSVAEWLLLLAFEQLIVVSFCNMNSRRDAD